MEYHVRIGIWEDGPVVYLSEDALKSFESRGMYVLYDSRASGSISINARITSQSIEFFPLPTNQAARTSIILPRENDARGWHGMIHVSRPLSREHEVRCALFEAEGRWAGDTFIVPVPRGHLLPYPAERSMSPDQIRRDYKHRLDCAYRFTGRRIVDDLPDYYKRVVFAPDWAETGEAPE